MHEVKADENSNLGMLILPLNVVAIIIRKKKCLSLMFLIQKTFFADYKLTTFEAFPYDFFSYLLSEK